MQYIGQRANSELEKILHENLIWKKQAEIKRYPHARILPNLDNWYLSGGVCDKDGSYIEDSALHEEYYDGSYSNHEATVVHKDKNAIFLGSWIGIYGHAITDNIKKLWIFLSQYKDLISLEDCDLVYNYLGSGSLPSFIINILSALDIDSKKLIELHSVTEYENVFIPSNTIIFRSKKESDSYEVRYYSNIYNELISKIVSTCCVPQKTISKIYLTRSKIKDGRDYGEKCIEQLFEQRGYTVISPEELSFQEQVSLIHNCDSIVCTEGSVSHNAVFCRPGTEVVILRKADYINSYQVMLNNMLRLKVVYIDANHTIKTDVPWAGPFFLWKTNNLYEFLDSSQKEGCIWFSRQWYRYLLRYCYLIIVRPLLVDAKKHVTRLLKMNM